jgi:Raf kinase inhibitor-like YbhB/YbcL family protein
LNHLDECGIATAVKWGSKMLVKMERSIWILVVVAAIGVTAAAAQAPAGGAGGQRGGPPVPPLTLLNSSWTDGGVIPQKFAGAMGVSPALRWTNVPMATVSFVLLMHDPDGAPQRGSADVLHWLVVNIPSTTAMLPEGWAAGSMPEGTKQIQVYRGPGAPAIAPMHHYTLELFALDEKLDLPANAARADVMKAMDMHVIGKAAYVGLYHQSPSQ